jgi:hypothetical protein
MKKGINCSLFAVFSKRAKFGNKFLLVKKFYKRGNRNNDGLVCLAHFYRV